MYFNNHLLQIRRPEINLNVLLKVVQSIANLGRNHLLKFNNFIFDLDKLIIWTINYQEHVEVIIDAFI